jgi:hypothetical protein
MVERDWLDKIYQKTFENAFSEIKDEKEKEKKISEAIEKSFPDVVGMYEKEFNKNALKLLKSRQKDLSKFKDRLNKRWKTGFDLYELFVSFNLEFGITISESYRKKKKDDIKFETILKLHARTCQISLEILELMKGGFADGAMARWRTLYEISVLSNFLVDKPNELIQKYLDYYFVENYYELIEYQKNCELLGYEPFPPEKVLETEKILTELKRKYGDNFIKQYGWAYDYLPKNKRNFSGLEETTEFKQLRSFYKMANNNVHSGAKGFIYKLGSINQNEVMLAGPTNYGFADPAQYSAFSLFQTTITLTEFESYFENTVFIKIGMNMLDKLTDEFIKIQKQIEFEENE